MRFLELISVLSGKEVSQEKNPEVKGLSCNSRLVEEGDLFFAMQGRDEDGANYIAQAVRKGAVAVVCEKKPQVNIPYIIVDNPRRAMSVLAARFYGEKHKSLKLIAVTGTNGKTTTSHLIYRGLLSAGKKAAVIGTLGIYFGKKMRPPTLTTPDPIYLHSLFAEMENEGIEYVVMEVSAHALQLEKVYGLRFLVSILTNVSEDHLDDFYTMDAYISAKKRLFVPEFTDFAVVCADDKTCFSVAQEEHIPVLTYGIYAPSDVFAIDLHQTVRGMEYVLNLFDEVFCIRSALLGDYNVENQLAAASVLAYLGVPLEKIAKFLSSNLVIEGRMERIAKWQGGEIFVDYAHTADGLEKALQTLKGRATGRLLCLFGCGGNREKEKRRIMGQIAGKYADFCIITSDNPRYEDPLSIIAEIEAGLHAISKNYVTIQDRRMAISYAVDLLSRGDVLLLAGKGGENFQEIMGIKYPFNDKKYVLELLQ